MTTQTPDAVREALQKIERAYREWDPDATFASTALAVVSKIAADALAALDSRAGDAGEASERMREAIDKGLQAFCGDTPDFTMSPGMRRCAADFILGQPGMWPATPAPAVDALPSDGTCSRCGAAPRHPNTGLCATCTDEAAPAVDAVPAGEAERKFKAALQDIAEAEAIPTDREAFIWCRDVARAALSTSARQ